MSKKIYVLDTNVVLNAGKQAFTSFEDNEVVLPFVVVEELEKKRLEDGQAGAMARYALREIEKLRSKGKLKNGVSVNSHGGTFRIEMNHRNPDSLPQSFANDRSNDVRVLTVANNLYLEELAKKENKEDYAEVILLTNDLPLRIKADTAFAMTIQPFWFKGSLYSGTATVPVSSTLIDSIYDKKNGFAGVDAPAKLVAIADEAHNHAFLLQSNTRDGHKAAVSFEGGKLKQLNTDRSAMGVVSGRSFEQKVALNYLFDDSKKVVSIGGKAGTGKTLLAVLSAMDQTIREQPKGKQQFGKITVIRPIYSVGGQELGFLPGTEDEKMDPWKAAIFDSMEGLVSNDSIKQLQEDNKFKVIPATFLRGRTFHDNFVIVDESQNFEPAVLLTILSRLGENSKIVFLWDATQKDNLSIGYNDGIVSVVEKLKSYDLFAHISLIKSERSKVAGIAGVILEDYIQ